MPKQTKKLSDKWIINTQDYFVKFLKVTKFPHPVRNGNRGSEFEYPEWLIMFIAVLSVKLKLKSYIKIHEMVTDYWKVITKGYKLKKPISETQLRERLKKICYKPGKTPAFIYQVFPQGYFR